MSEDKNERRKKKWIIKNTLKWYHYKDLDETILTIS